jgi:hypothetical protein
MAKARSARERRIRLVGSAARLLRNRHRPEVVLDGPYGTGKTRALLEYVNKVLVQYHGTRALLLRKTLTSLAASALVTFREQVLSPGDAYFYSGSKDRPAGYEYFNGSVLVVGGMDRPDKVLSTEYDLIAVPECRDLKEEEWEALGARLRHGVAPFQQMVGDCNPAGPNHWLKRREQRGQLLMLHTRLRDNPAYFKRGAWTPQGAAYRERLNALLTGVRRARYLDGRWVAAEGVIYEGWDETVHLITRRDIPGLVDGEFPGVWPRDWSVDFGYTNPFVWQQWIEDPDGRLYLEKEIYRTQRIVADHAALIRAVTAGDPPPRRLVCDHDAEDRATLERELGVPARPATKSVSPGIQAVQARLRAAGDGRPRLFILADALRERDPLLVEAGRPTCTAEEWDSYVWDAAREAPVKEHDHGLDALRYEVATRDGVTQGAAGETGSFDYRRGRWVES